MQQDRAMERRVLWKLDTHILPPLALLWLCNFIDRSNIGSEIVGLESDTKLHGNQFNIVLSVFYITYILVELPSNLIMKRMKPARWICTLVFTWGAVTTLTCLVHNFAGLIVIRMFLGLCEGGLLPGIVLYLSTIYKPHELQLRVGIFYASASLSGAFGGLLATGILNMDGIAQLAGWRWIFLLEGLATVVASLISAYFLPSSIAEAKFLTENEREFALQRFHRVEAVTTSTSDSADAEKAEKASTTEHVHSPSPSDVTPVHFAEEQFEWREVVRGLTDFQVWVTGIAYLGLIVRFFIFERILSNRKIRCLGYKGKSAQLHTVPPYVPATVLTVVVAFLSDRLQWRGPFILICLPFSIARYILAIAAKTNAQRYGAVFLIAAGIYPSAPSILGFIATNIYTSDQLPTFYRRGHSIVLAFLILSWILIAVNVLYCIRENKARAAGQRQGNIAAYDELVRSGKTKAPIGDRHPDVKHRLLLMTRLADPFLVPFYAVKNATLLYMFMEYHDLPILQRKDYT
ncbi:MFS transporter [Mycena amicta]|nr:MFS transporter [Mycena amicta]